MNERIQSEEISQAKARIVIATLCLFVMTGLYFFVKIEIQSLYFIAMCSLFSVFWLGLLRRYPADSLGRRRFISLFDIGVISIALHISGDWGAIFYFLYLWIIVGNGMRFGSQSLIEVMTLGVVGYAIVILNTEYWLNNMPTAVGLLVGLIILPSFYIVLIKRLHTLNDKLNRELQKTTYAATHDGMTNLMNREYFFQRMEEKVNSAERYGENFAVVFIDLDGFKAINDSFGHHYGDELLKSTASKIQNAVRKCDLVARLGGDEFAIILDDIYEDQIDAFAKRLLTQIENCTRIEEKEIQITASVGISLYPDHGKIADTLVKAADTAMYRSKKNGKNSYTRMNAIATHLQTG